MLSSERSGERSRETGFTHVKLKCTWSASCFLNLWACISDLINIIIEVLCLPWSTSEFNYSNSLYLIIHFKGTLVALEYLRIRHAFPFSGYPSFFAIQTGWSFTVISPSSSSSLPENGLHAVYSSLLSGGGTLSSSVPVIIFKPRLAACYPLSDYKP